MEKGEGLRDESTTGELYVTNPMCNGSYRRRSGNGDPNYGDFT